MRLVPKALFPIAAILLSGTALAQPAVQPAPVAEIIGEIDIPFERFTLDNGLTVITHTDRKAPVVAVSVWYNVGSKHEPEGKTGYAHLFEHLMFNGSEHAPGDYFEPLKQLGATDFNGTTWLDRTNYFQTVPKSALEAALFLESDRMGHLLGAVTQEKLDNQIGVVSNEKRQGDNQPYGLVGYKQTELLFPRDHPYGHETIGSLADLEAASLDDMRDWFRGHYGPNNAILVLAGDIDAGEARPLVDKWFGDIPAGPEVAAPNAPVPTLDEPAFATMHDRIATPRIYRNWVVPGLNDADYADLNVAMAVFGGLASSRLDNILVREEELAVAVAAYVLPFVEASIVQIQADVRPGVDVDAFAARLDELIADYIESGPTPDEIQRVAMRNAAGTIAGLEQVGGFSGKAVTLAEGELYSDDPEHYKRELAETAAVTPDSAVAAMRKWLTRPVVGITVLPGEREAYEDTAGQGAGGEAVGFAPAYYLDAEESTFAGLTAVDRTAGVPPVGEVPNVDFPSVETAELSNGIPVYFARRDAVPMARIVLSFDAGQAADPKDKPGLHNFTVGLLEEGTASLTATELAEVQERLGASLFAGGGNDRTSVGIRALTANLGPSLDLLEDVVKHPAFRDGDIARVRTQQLTAIEQEANDPGSVSLNMMMPLIFGTDHPYGRDYSGNGTAETVGAITRDDLIAFHRGWLRPEKAAIFAVGDLTLVELMPELEQRFGTWSVAGKAAPGKNFDVALPPGSERIIVVHRPNSPQSFIRAGQLLPLKGSDDLLALGAANEILGGDFLSRINMDLRETKGWSYGVRASLLRNEEDVAYVVRAPVQTNQTGPAIAALKAHHQDFLSGQGVTATELQRVKTGNVRELPGKFETASSVLGQMQADRLYDRPFDYAEQVADEYRALEAATLDKALADVIDPATFTWVVVGDAALIAPQLEPLGMPIEYIGFSIEQDAFDAADSDVTAADEPDESVAATQ